MSPYWISWWTVEPLLSYSNLTVFKMMAVHHLRVLKIWFFYNCKYSSGGRHAKVGGELSNHCWDMTILQFSKTAAVCHLEFLTRKPRKGAAVIAASMHGFASCRKFKSPVTLTLDRVKVKSAYTVHVEMCSYGQLSEVQMLRDLDLESGQGQVNIHSTCRTSARSTTWL